MFKRFLSLFMAFLMVYHVVACAATPRRPEGTISSPPTLDAGQPSPVDVVLLGLPEGGTDVVLPEVVSLITPGGANGEAIVPLAARAPAPFNGVLFNGPAVARVSVEFRGQQERCLIDRRHDVDLVVARYNADVASLQLALDTQSRMDQVLLTGRDQDIARLNRLLQAQTPDRGPHIAEGLVWASGGLLLGAAVVGGILLLSNLPP